MLITAFKITTSVLNTYICSDAYEMNFQVYGSLGDFSRLRIFLLILIYEGSATYNGEDFVHFFRSFLDTLGIAILIKNTRQVKLLSRIFMIFVSLSATANQLQ